MMIFAEYKFNNIGDITASLAIYKLFKTYKSYKVIVILLTH